MGYSESKHIKGQQQRTPPNSILHQTVATCSVWDRLVEKDVLHCDLKVPSNSYKSQTFSFQGHEHNIKIAATRGKAPQISILLAANHLVAVVLLSKLPKRRLDDTTTKTQNKMKSRL